MTVTRTDLESAAFWDHAICLDCGSSFEVGGGGDEPDTSFGDFGRRLAPCADCGSPRTFSASLVLDILGRVADEEAG